MGPKDCVSDLFAAMTYDVVEAEASGAAKHEETESQEAAKSEASGEGADEGAAEESGEEEQEGQDEEKEEEEEEEEEEEPEDPKPKLEEECLKTAQCAPLKHHYDECAERVQQQIDDNGAAEENCVEEYFHMMHCASQCAAPKLFKQLR